VNSSGMLPAAGFGISTFACPAGRVRAGNTPIRNRRGALICISRMRHRERRLVVLFGLPRRVQPRS
jgi:hypothetical protein